MMGRNLIQFFFSVYIKYIIFFNIIRLNIYIYANKLYGNKARARDYFLYIYFNFLLRVYYRSCIVSSSRWHSLLALFQSNLINMLA